MKRRQVVAVDVLLLICSSPILGYPDCAYPEFRSTGYTYTVDRISRAKTWSFCHFPNPMYDHTLCGMPEIDGHYYLCDPENFLSQADGKQAYGLFKFRWSAQVIFVSQNDVHKVYVGHNQLFIHSCIPDLIMCFGFKLWRQIFQLYTIAV